MIGSVEFCAVRKVYRWRGTLRRGDSIKGAVFWRPRRSTVQQHLALDGVDLDIVPGEALAIIGPNGSGKSTLLKLAGGILRPTAGTVSVSGRVTALIELGAGFHPEITGRENVVINGMLLGLSRAEVERKMPEILDFADIGPFIDEPVKTYSSGMYVRLGFAVAVAVEPNVLLIDEVLAVGDERFTRRCLDRLARMRRAGVTMVIVTHDLDLVTQLSDRAAYLREGRIVLTGPPDSTVARYLSDVADSPPGERSTPPHVRVVEEGRRWGNGDVEVIDVVVESGGVRCRMVPSGADCTVIVRYRAHRQLTDFVFGVAWHRVDGSHVAGHNTDLDGLKSRRLATAGTVRCRYDALELAPGEYLIDAAVHGRDGLAYDYWRSAAAVRVTSAIDWPGVYAPPHSWLFDGPEWE